MNTNTNPANTEIIEISNFEIDEPAISIKDLKKSFGSLVVLDGVNIDIKRGENLAVLGKSGSGKSVLIKIISGLLKPDSGTVKVFGQEVDKISKDELQLLRQKIGFSFQNSALYDSMTVRGNLEYPLTRNKRELSSAEVNQHVLEVLEEVGLPQTINQMPSELSGGQRKRIGIARTLIMKPEIMLYDEPTAGLDPITCIEINNLISKVQRQYKTTSIIITHDLTCAKMTANRLAILLKGKFLVNGSFEEVFNSENPEIKAFYDYNFINNIV
jgi:phospholipid/cholesterol/gamma-HCH transport system ATP-binding protein